MAVQAQNPTNVINPEHRHWMRQSLVGENRNSLSQEPDAYGAPILEEFQQLQNGVTAGESINKFRLFGTTTNPVQSTLLNRMTVENNANLGCNFVVTKKRSRESEEFAFKPQRGPEIINYGDFQPNYASSLLLPTSADRASMLLGLDNDRKTSAAYTSIGVSKVEIEKSSYLSSISEDLSFQLQRQKDEIDQLIKSQGERLRVMVEEKRQQHMAALLAVVEERSVKLLRKKEFQAATVNRRNMELEEKIKHLSVEAHLWQKQAKNNEAMVSALRCNLQQAVALSREQSKEGCGDSEYDDAASSHLENLADTHARAFQENKELKERKTCRVCRCNDVSILLLPCRHLCLCKDCETRLDACPICRSMKNASVQVYMA